MDPIAFHIGPLAVHWYGIMYLFAFAIAWGLAYYRRNRVQPRWSSDTISDLIFYSALGAIIGGRIGYTLVYNWSHFIASPGVLFRVWDGGMSFHGGMVGVAVATWVFARIKKRHWCDVVDFAVPLVPIGLGLGRLGNFINGELMGRVSHLPWAMIYTNGGPLPRHPSPLYEFLLEGVVLFILLWWFSSRRRPRFAVTSLFLVAYGVLRFVLEFFRQPDPQLGFIAWHWLTMGQLLSFPMVLVGCITMYWSYTRTTRRPKD
jgi:phosphatidylglycerol:prolipoprotein diacylglycerol transferase